MMATNTPENTFASMSNSQLNTPKLVIPENHAHDVLCPANFSLSPVKVQEKLKPKTPPGILALRASGRSKENGYTMREEAGCHFSQEIRVNECEFEEGSKPFHLGGKRFAVVKQFRGVPYVNVREYYKMNGSNRMLPGKKGINLTAENWWKLVGAKFEISNAVRAFSNVKK
ncbi:uncharacterized protein LOC129273183 [Lytechinus pictus]|uniref:uncharacterized protein LOC129273183 n=1 Tax=Lytechinus pictus TaxID=7653 RepID=UPI0030B9EDB1